MVTSRGNCSDSKSRLGPAAIMQRQSTRNRRRVISGWSAKLSVKNSICEILEIIGEVTAASTGQAPSVRIHRLSQSALENRGERERLLGEGRGCWPRFSALLPIRRIYAG